MKVVSLFPLAVKVLPVLILTLAMYLTVIFPVVGLMTVRGLSNGKKNKSPSSQESE